MANIEPLFWINVALVIVISVIGFFLKRLIDSVDKLETKVYSLDKSVGIILDRDRRQRIQDYAAENNFGS